MLVYVAAPYSHSDPAIVAQRMDMFTLTMAKLIEDGLHPVSPLMNHYLTDRIKVNFPLSWEYWESYSRVLLDRCDELIVIRMDGWQHSTGVLAEIAMAEKSGKAIQYIDPVMETEHA